MLVVPYTDHLSEVQGGIVSEEHNSMREWPAAAMSKCFDVFVDTSKQ